MMIFVIAAIVGLAGFACYFLVFKKEGEEAKEGGDDLYLKLIDNEL